MAWLEVGGFMFWIAVAVSIIVLFCSIVNSSASLGLVDIVIAGLVLQFLFKLDIVGTLHLPTTWWGWLLVVLGYAVCGVVWSIYRFYVCYRREVMQVLSRKETWLIDNRNLSAEEQIAEWNKYVDKNCPDPTSYLWREKITEWISFWVTDLLIYLFHDLLTEWANLVYDWLRSFYTRIADHIRNTIKMQLK